MLDRRCLELLRTVEAAEWVDLRRELAAALEADTPDAEAVQRLTGELRAADANLVAAKLLEPELPAPVITETRQFDSKLAELRASVDLTKHVKAALAGTIAQAGPEAEYNAELKIEAGWFPLDLLTRQLEDRAKRDGDGMASQATWLDYMFEGTAAERLGISFRPVGAGTHSVPTFSAAPGGVQRGRERGQRRHCRTPDRRNHRGHHHPGQQDQGRRAAETHAGLH